MRGPSAVSAESGKDIANLIWSSIKKVEVSLRFSVISAVLTKM